MNWYHREPTLQEMFLDSVIQAVMEADGVDPQELEVMLRQVGQNARLVRRVRRWGPWSRLVRHASE